jgi:FkbM family methyltransferase
MVFNQLVGRLSSVFRSDFKRDGAPLCEVEDLSAERRTENQNRMRQLCHAAYLGDHTALCRMLGRFKLYVDTRDIGIAPHLMLDGFWEMWVTEVIAAMVRPGMVVADIGANLGYFTVLMAQLVGRTGHVHAFEPNPRMVDLLHRSLEVNGFSQHVSLHQVGLCAENGTDLALIIPPGEPKNAHIVSLGEVLPEHGVRVPGVRLDSRAEWAKIEFAKIDVEGAEQLIWAGSQGLLDNRTLKTVILEFTPGRYADPGDFLDRLTAPGFTLSRIDYHVGIEPITKQDVLARDPTVDIMLVLQR